MHLRPFTMDLAPTVAGWATTPVDRTMVYGEPDAPGPVGQGPAWVPTDDVLPFTLWADERRAEKRRAEKRRADELIVAYGELWLDDEESEVELARLIVDPARRGEGIGRVLVTRLVERARTFHPDVFLRVRPDNAAARRCYAAAGLVRVAPELEAEWNAPQPVAYVWLTAPTT